MKRIIFLLGIFLLCAPARAWWPEGHGILSEAATRALPSDVPKFFRENARAIAHHSFDPDVAKNRAAPRATNAEYSEHFIDWELIEPALGEEPFPKTRYEFLKFCYDNNLEPQSVGLLPFAVAEWTERLKIHFAEHRRWPKNKRIWEKCLVTAGTLAHYAEDLCQPLHVTIHHDGRAKSDNSSPKTGIHAKVDGLIEALKLSPKELALKELKGQSIAPPTDLMAGILAEIQASRAHVETVYALEGKLPEANQKVVRVDSGVLQMTTERARASTRFTAALFLWAWRDSAKVELPIWLRREEK